MAHRVTLIPGDGTGPELTEATRRVLEATGVDLDWDLQQAGVDVMEEAGTPLPEETLASVRENGVALKGPITTPIGTGFRSVNVALRHELELYACLRPCKTFPGVRSRYESVDVVVVRENTEDLYAGIEYEAGSDAAETAIESLNALQPKQIAAGSGVSVKPISAAASERIIRFAFEYARENGRREVAGVTKANIMKFTDGLFLAVFREVAADYPDIASREVLVDALTMQLVQRPEEFDVLVLPNLYGDIISDLTAGLVGGPRGRAGSEHRRDGCRLRGDPRIRAEVHGAEQGQPDGDDPVGQADARPPRRARRCCAPRGCGRRSDRRGTPRDLRHEADPRRSDRSRHLGVRGRDHREARGSGLANRKRDQMRRKVTVVGAGNVGSTCAQELARRDYADVVLVDIIPNYPQGKALDMNQAAAVLGYEPTITGTNGYEETAGSDVVVITAGRPRTPGMSRDDLVTTNEAIVSAVTKEAVRQSPDAILVVVSNPLDAMCHVAKAASRFKKHRVVGMAGILDTARFAAFISQELDVSVKDVTAVVLGGHGDQMVPVVSATNVGGVPLPELMPKSRIRKLVDRTRFGGGELVQLLGTSAWYAPGAAAAQMVDSICLDEKRILPCTAYLEGEYGIRGLYMGVPVKLGTKGVEEIVKLRLTADEKKMLRASAAAVRDVVGVLKKR